jgi:hypothetical protein
MFTKRLSACLTVIILLSSVNYANAKSVFAIIDHGFREFPPYPPAKIAAYGIDGDQITLQEIFTPDPNFYQTGASHGPVGLAVDSNSAHLFVT